MLICMIISLTINVFAQAPPRISYQAVISNSSGQLLSNETAGMLMIILEGSATGKAVYV